MSNDEPDAANEHSIELVRDVTLNMIPTLRYLYKNKTLKNIAKDAAKFANVEAWLAKVSL